MGERAPRELERLRRDHRFRNWLWLSRASLARNFASPGCGDRSESVVAAALRVHPLDLKETEALALDSTSKFEKCLPLEQATRKSYAVLVHEPSAASHPELFTELKDFLLGRRAEGLQWLFRNRGLAAPRLSDFEGDTGVSLKTLDALWRRQILGQENLSPLLQALRELII